MGKAIDLSRVPEVEDWVSLPQVAQMLGISRQQVHKLAAQGYFKSLSRIGNYVVVTRTEANIKIFERRVDKD